MTVAEAQSRLSKGQSPEDAAVLILGAALNEPNRERAEAFCRAWVRDTNAAAARAGLLGLAHLARRFGRTDGATWALVQAAAVDSRFEGTWRDVIEDFRTFVPAPPLWDKPVRVVDGIRIDNLEGLWDEVTRSLIPGTEWGRNLDAFNDILRGGFGTPEDGFVIRWLNVERSRQVLGWNETVRWYESTLERCHESNRERLLSELKEARQHIGQTLFEMVAVIIRSHGPAGRGYSDMIDLELDES